MNERPAISVIVAVYKAESYLRKCLDSLLAQTFQDFEVLLVDDGSPDHSGAICDEYAATDSRFRVFHKENGGVSSARQCGIDHARGEYTIHADPDDWVEPNMLAQLYAKAKAEDADMVICDYYVDARGNSRRIVQRPSALDHETVLRELFQQLHGNCWNKLIRSSCYKKYNIRFPVNINYGEDLCVNVQLLLHPIKIAYAPMAFYHYVQDANPLTLSRSKTLATWTMIEQLNQILHNILSSKEYYQKIQLQREIDQAYRALYSNCLKSSFYRKHYLPIYERISYSFQIKDERNYVKLAIKHYIIARFLVNIRMSTSRLVRNIILRK